jgi:hypothetical protein
MHEKQTQINRKNNYQDLAVAHFCRSSCRFSVAGECPIIFNDGAYCPGTDELVENCVLDETAERMQSPDRPCKLHRIPAVLTKLVSIIVEKPAL